MEADATPRAWEALQKARAAAPKATAREQALIEALSARYTDPAPEDRTALDGAYMVAMRAVAQRFPDDLDIQVLFAESLLDLRPWRWYTRAGEPEPGTEELVSILEAVLAKAPEHPGAIHYYIHGTEGSLAPERAEKYADRLPSLAPGLGHLVHMPSHTYFQIGRYHDGVRVNLEAEQADNAYVTQCHAQGVYPLAYIPHNPHFGWACAAMAGQSEQALRLAEMTVQHTDTSMLREAGMGTLQHYSVIPLWAYTRFGRWSTLLSQPAPPADLKYPNGVWRYTRGLAYARTERADLAQAEWEALRALAADDSLEQVTIWDINKASDLLQIAQSALAGEIAATRRDWTTAITHLREAVRREDALNYNEPPDWHFPVRHMLGAVLLQAGQAAEAERVYREDLQIHPENGWALMGLANSLVGQSKSGEAKGVTERFQKAFAHADVRILASRF
jgi:tetratricopeptide (TPR) repeat protein